MKTLVSFLSVLYVSVASAQLTTVEEDLGFQAVGFPAAVISDFPDECTLLRPILDTILAGVATEERGLGDFVVSDSHLGGLRLEYEWSPELRAIFQCALYDMGVNSVKVSLNVSYLENGEANNSVLLPAWLTVDPRLNMEVFSVEVLRSAMPEELKARDFEVLGVFVEFTPKPEDRLSDQPGSIFITNLDAEMPPSVK